MIAIGFPNNTIQALSHHRILRFAQDIQYDLDHLLRPSHQVHLEDRLGMFQRIERFYEE